MTTHIQTSASGLTDDRPSASGLIVDRRELLAGAAALGLSTAFAGPALAADTPKKGGTLRLGMQGGSASDSLDPRTYADSIPIAYSCALWNLLVEIDAKGNATGELAESWEAKPGAVEWIFHLRKGVHFTSGKEFDADDAIYSINLHRGDTKSPAKDVLSPITDIKKIDASTLSITLSGGNADLPFVLSDYHLLMFPAGTTDFSKPDGTGAFTLETWEPGVRVVLKRKAGDYWKPGRGNFDFVEIRYIIDAAARTQALMTGQVDAVNRLDPKTTNLVMKNPNINVVRSRGTGNRYAFVAHRDTKPYDNADVMLGLKYGIDRQKIVDTVFSGFASLGNDHLIGPTNKYFATDLPQRPFDPDKAAFHFKKAGFSGPFDLEVSEGAYAGATDSAVLYQEALKKSGATLNVKRVSGDGYWSNVWLKSAFCAVYWGSRPTADLQLSQAFLSTAAWNDTNWKREDFDKIIIAARAELDDAKRKQMYIDAQKMISDDGGMICFAVSDYLDGYSKKVKGAEPHARYDLNDERIAEKGWFA
ncbi:MAG: ABC transporter substrate-binding protein [Ancalomicrobiaceae bacterium]|nr:ABC transporter substrate-binding protein [Ancalomicrobiaceae bacterium]